MTSIGNNMVALSQLPATLPLDGLHSGARHSASSAERTPRLASDKSEELRVQFTQFVGEAFYGQMLKAMRSTVGKPAYFHGGRAEEVFQGQLDQQMTEHLTAASAERFAEPMFERQFPHLAKKNDVNVLSQLTQLRRM